MLNFSGFKSRPEELEQTLVAVAGVRDAAALTHAADDGVVRLCIGLVLDEGVSLASVAPAVREALKVPVKAMVVRQFNTLPRTSTGKLRRKALLPFFVDPAPGKA